MKMPQGRPMKSYRGQYGRHRREGERRLHFNTNDAVDGSNRNRKINLHLRKPQVHRRLAFARPRCKRPGRILRRLGGFAATTALGVRCGLCGRHRFGTANANRVGQNQAQPRHHHCLPTSFHKGQSSELTRKVNLGLAKTRTIFVINAPSPLNPECIQ